MTILKFTVLPPNSSWNGFPGGENEETDPSEELLRHAGSAHAAGVIDVTEGLVDDHVESQGQSEANLVEAMGSWVEPVYRGDGTREPGHWDGPWYAGHVEQLEADAVADRTDVEVDLAAIESTDVADLSNVLGKDA